MFVIIFLRFSIIAIIILEMKLEQGVLSMGACTARSPETVGRSHMQCKTSFIT